MATQIPPTPLSRLALRATAEPGLPDGAWWPRSRILGDELSELFEVWPSGAGHIVRVLYSPPDWDDRPRSAQVLGRRVKTGNFPRDDTRRVVLTMHDGGRRSLVVIPADTSDERAMELLGDVTAQAPAGEHSP